MASEAANGRGDANSGGLSIAWSSQIYAVEKSTILIEARALVHTFYITGRGLTQAIAFHGKDGQDWMALRRRKRHMETVTDYIRRSSLTTLLVGDIHRQPSEVHPWLGQRNIDLHIRQSDPMTYRHSGAE